MSSPVWGVELLYTPYLSESGGGSLAVSIFLCKRNPGKLPRGQFFTNRSIREVMLNHPDRLTIIGSIRLNILKGGRSASWENFYPFDMLPKSISQIRRIGIAQLAELHTLLRLKKDFPNVKWITHDITIRSREDHVRSRGLRTRSGRVRYETFALDREIRLLRKKIARDMWWRIPPRPGSVRARLHYRRWTHATLVRRPRKPK